MQAAAIGSLMASLVPPLADALLAATPAGTAGGTGRRLGRALQHAAARFERARETLATLLARAAAVEGSPGVACMTRAESASAC